jgi:hypothetical protein
MKQTCALVLAGIIAISAAKGQDAPTAGAGGVAPPPAFVPIKLDDLPKDANGFLSAAVWDIIQTKATANPHSNYGAAVQSRPAIKGYYATFAQWKAPELPALPEGKLRNLPDVPKEPRFPLTDKVWPEKAGDASVCLWEDDKLAAMSLGVDDNCSGDLPYWQELSKKYGGLNVTWNLISGNIDGAFDKGRISMYGTWSLWQNMLDKGFHLASHSVMHCADPVPEDGWPGPEWEVAESQHQIDSHLPGHKTKIFVYPGAGVGEFGIPHGYYPNNPWRPSIVKYYAGARGGGGQPINQANMIDYFEIHSTTAVQNVLDSTDPKAAEDNLNNIFAADPKSPYHKYYRGWATIFIHFINAGKDFDTNPYYVQYGKCLAFYNDHREDLWTGYFDDVATYGEERDTATLTTGASSDVKISLTLTDKMDPAVFDYPLTVKVRLPDSWKGVAATQGAKSLSSQVIAHEGANFALVKAVPDQGEITLVSAPAAAK